ncbi:MAG: phycobilisome protein [Xenococcaceae cyanobacterium]
MHTDLEIAIRKAEFEYLQQPEMDALRQCVGSLQERLEIYQFLRDKEIEIFQPIAEQLLETYSDGDRQLIERALKHWLSAMRYCAMAMLLNNSGFLQHRLLEWLSPVASAHQMESINKTLYGFLLTNLGHILSKKQLTILQPFLEQARVNLTNELAFQTSGV